jgi:hypothetical protein
MVLEFEIERWKGFRDAVQSGEDREAFDTLMDMCRSNSMAAGAACNPIPFEPMLMSILLAKQKNIADFEYDLQDLLWRKMCIEEKLSKREDK